MTAAWLAPMPFSFMNHCITTRVVSGTVSVMLRGHYGPCTDQGVDCLEMDKNCVLLHRGGGWKKIARMEKNCVPPPPSRGCLRKKSCPAIIVAFGKFFTQGQLLVQKWNSFHQISLCTLACTELFEPIDHFKFVLLVEVICEGAFFFCF